MILYRYLFLSYSAKNHTENPAQKLIVHLCLTFMQVLLQFSTDDDTFFHGWLYNHPDAEKRVIFIQVKHEANNSASNTRIHREHRLRIQE
jgi:hypothetical protein